MVEDNDEKYEDTVSPFCLSSKMSTALKTSGSLLLVSLAMLSSIILSIITFREIICVKGSNPSSCLSVLLGTGQYNVVTVRNCMHCLSIFNLNKRGQPKPGIEFAFSRSYLTPSFITTTYMNSKYDCTYYKLSIVKPLNDNERKYLNMYIVFSKVYITIKLLYF